MGNPLLVALMRLIEGWRPQVSYRVLWLGPVRAGWGVMPFLGGVSLSARRRVLYWGLLWWAGEFGLN